MALIALVTTWLTLFSWRGLTEQPEEFLLPVLVAGLVVTLTGVLARRLRLPAVLVLLTQLVVGTLLILGEVTGSVIPTPTTLADVEVALRAAVDSAGRYSAPVPATVAPVHPLLMVGGLACLVLVDFLACTLRRVPLAGLPLLTVYSLPLNILGGSVDWWIFVAAAAGFLGLLYVQGSEQIGRWGRPVAHGGSGDVSVTQTRPTVVDSPPLRSSATLIGVVATALALAVPLAVPTLSLAVLGNGPGGGGGDEIKLENPTTDLRRNLLRGEDDPLITFETSDPSPGYLRVSVLTNFGNDAWTSGNRSLPEEQRANGRLPDLEGVDASVPREEVDYDFLVEDQFRSTWLPTPALASEVRADGAWKYDTDTMDFLASEKGLDTAGISYTATEVELGLEAADLAAAPGGADEVDDTFTDLPSNLPDVVRNLAESVAGDAETRFEKAVALQTWFRTDGGFTYSIERAEPGNGSSALEQFLAEDGGRVGYCEQFASAMAVMARTLDIPARVAVGFLRPDRLSPDIWEYSAWDMHAWPELFFPGAGWVRFEPTPPTRANSVPPYTRQQVAPAPEPSAQPSQSQRQAPSQAPSARVAPSDAPVPETAAGSDGDEGLPWGTIMAVGLALVLLTILALLPRGLRRAHRTRRWTAGDPDSAWTELRASVLDLGLGWPEGLSPRATRDVVARWLAPVAARATEQGADEVPLERPRRGPETAPEAAEALDRLTAAVERQRYARSGSTVDAASLHRDVDHCVASLTAGVSRSSRTRAAWWPRSVFERNRDRAGSPGGQTGSHERDEETPMAGSYR
ncbi:DUF3488 and transglutaminase-like domain-containing protein [Nocardioides pacificus]